MIHKSNLNIILYIETRPEGINESSIKLLKKLKVDGVGMGIEISTQDFREEKLKRFADQKKIIKALDFTIIILSGQHTISLVYLSKTRIQY